MDLNGRVPGKRLSPAPAGQICIDLLDCFSIIFQWWGRVAAQHGDVAHVLAHVDSMPYDAVWVTHWIFAGHRRDLEGLSWPVEPHWGAAHAIPALGHSPQEETPWLSEAVNEVRGNQWADEVGYFQHRPPNIFQFVHTQASCHQAESFLKIWLVQHPRSVRNESHTEAVPECSSTATVPSVLHACLGQAKTTAFKGLAEAHWCWLEGCRVTRVWWLPELLMPKGSQHIRQETIRD